MPSSVASMALACLERLTACLNRRVGICFLPVLLALSPRSKVGIFLHHIGVKIVLPFCEVGSVPYNLLCTQAVVLLSAEQRPNAGGAFSRPCVPPPTRYFLSLPARLRNQPPSGKTPVSPLGTSSSKNSGLAVISVSTNRVLSLRVRHPALFNAALNEVVIASLRLDDMEIVLAPAGVNVGIAGVLFLLPFVMGFQRSCRIALVFSNRKIACCAMKLLSPFRSFPGLFHRKIPQKISQIGREWIRYK